MPEKMTYYRLNLFMKEFKYYFNNFNINYRIMVPKLITQKNLFQFLAAGKWIRLPDGLNKYFGGNIEDIQGIAITDRVM